MLPPPIAIIRLVFHADLGSTSIFDGKPQRYSDVYVLYLLHPEIKQTVDPLNLEQWEFYVFPTKYLNEYTRIQSILFL